MMARSISRLMLGLSLAAFHQNAEATQEAATPGPLSADCLSQLAKVTPSLPTVAEMLDVDPVKTPWGINLSLVEEFGGRFRNTKGLGDECNIAPRITNYQKNLSDLKKVEIIIPIIQEMINNVSLDADTKLKSLEEKKTNKGAKAKEQQQISHDKEVALRPLLDKMTKLKRDADLAKMGIDKNKNNYKMMRAMGLTDQQIAKLPDLDAWKAMKQESRQAAVPPRPQTPLPPKAGSTPPKRSLPPVPQRNPGLY